MSLLRASFWLTIAELFFNLSGYITHALLGRLLGPGEYGRYSLVITVATMIVVLIGRGVPIAMSKYLSAALQNRNEQKQIKATGARVQTILIGLTTIIYYLAAPLLAKLLRDSSLTSLFRLSSLIIPAFAAASFYVYYFTGRQQFNRQAALKFFRGLSKIFFIVLLAWQFQTRGAIWGHIIAPFSVFLLALALDKEVISTFRLRIMTKKIITAITRLWLYLKTISSQFFFWKNLNQRISPLKILGDLKPTLSKERKNYSSSEPITAGKLLNFAWPITLFMLFYEIMITIDLYMVKGLLGSDTLAGWYNAALTIARLPFYAFYFLTIILLPKVSELTANRDGVRVKRLISLSMRFLFILLIPAAALLSVFAQDLLFLFYGQAFLAAAPALQILAFGLSFLTVFYILTFILNGAGYNKIPMWTSLTGMIINGLLNYFFIQRWQLVGAAGATTITAFLAMLIALYYTRKKITSFGHLFSLLKYLLATIVIVYIAYHLPATAFRLFWIPLLFFFYFVILWALKEITPTDLSFLLAALSRKKK